MRSTFEWRKFAKVAARTGIGFALYMSPVMATATEVPFGAEIIASGFAGASSTSLADINSDGNIDIVAIAEATGQLAWWESVDQGAAWIEHRIIRVSGLAPLSTADMDGDGDPDIVTASGDLSAVAWLENDGGGIDWQPRLIDTNFAGTKSLATADFDSDGDLDVVAAGVTNNEIRWWINLNGDGTDWQPRTIATGASGVDELGIADIDADGAPDVLTAGTIGDIVLWWRNENDGADWPAFLVANNFIGASSISSADVDGDGDADLLGASRQGDRLVWWSNVIGNGTIWAEISIDEAVDGPTSIIGFDIDRDGDTDAIAASADGNELIWWENEDIVGTDWIEHTIDTGLGGPSDLALGDIDADGDPDLAGALTESGQLAWWDNETVHRASIFPIKMTINADVPGASVVVAHDLDQDGDLDLVGAASSGQDIRWWENEGLGLSWTERIIDGGFDGAQNVEVADIDGDGDPDVIGAAETADRISWWENVLGDALTWDEHDIVVFFDGALDVDAADVDGDGDLDVIGAATNSDDVTWFENLDGVGLTWARQEIDDGADGARSATAADFDGDGDLDVIGAMFNSDDITWWENFDGVGGDWITRTLEGGFDGADMVTSGDIDLDGDIDVIAAGLSADDITWWENEDGFGTTWIERPIEGSFNGATSVVATDMDADGDLDILAAANLEDEIRWWENVNGDGQTWTERTTVENFDGASWAIFADIDSDGKPDVIGAALNAGEISWWSNDGGQASFVTDNTAPAAMADGALDDVLKIEIVHEGRAGDNEIEPASLHLLLEEEDGDPLTSEEANALFQSLSVFSDDGSGRFEEANDPLVASFSNLDLADGSLDLVLPDDIPALQAEFGERPEIFVAVELNEDASLQDTTTFQMSHLTELTTAEDAKNDTPLEVQLAARTTSRNVRASGTVPSLEVSGICPGPVTVVVSNATVGEVVQVLQAPAEGTFTLGFGGCSGVEFDLANPQLILSLVANVDGEAIAVELLDAGECGGFMQALDLSRCLPSNVDQSPLNLVEQQ